MSNPLNAFAQQGTSSIVGTVVNSQKIPVAGAKIVLKDAAGKTSSEALTDKDGFYRFDNLTVGQYQLALEPPRPYRGEVISVAVVSPGLTADWMVSANQNALNALAQGIATQGGVALGDVGTMIALQALGGGFGVGMAQGFGGFTKKAGSPSK
jgi:hypothetical protein